MYTKLVKHSNKFIPRNLKNYGIIAERECSNRGIMCFYGTGMTEVIKGKFWQYRYPIILKFLNI